MQLEQKFETEHSLQLPLKTVLGSLVQVSGIIPLYLVKIKLGKQELQSVALQQFSQEGIFELQSSHFKVPLSKYLLWHFVQVDYELQVSQCPPGTELQEVHPDFPYPKASHVLHSTNIQEQGLH